MINAAAPSIPNQDVVFEAITPETPNPAMKVDPLRWYQSLNNVFNFLITLRNSPQQVQQSDLAELLRKLIKTGMQPGVQVWVPGEFQHLLRFNGTGWNFAPSDQGSGYYVDGFADPPSPAGWALADGSTKSYLKSDGSIGTRMLSTTANRWFRQ